MSIERITAESVPQPHDRKHGSRADSGPPAPGQPEEPLTLRIDDDAGGDPYNRTGQHCLAELKDRQR